MNFDRNTAIFAENGKKLEVFLEIAGFGLCCPVKCIFGAWVQGVSFICADFCLSLRRHNRF